MEIRPLLLDPGETEAVIFDLDGVVTDTATVHAAAWKQLFDQYLLRRSQQTGEPFLPFDDKTDYLKYVDGKPRYDGVKSFLASRRIELPYGSPAEPPEAETICGLGNQKNLYFNQRLAETGPEVFASTVALIQNLRRAGIKTAIISASENCAMILKTAGIEGLFDARVDGNDSTRLGLQGKPAPDIFLEAARQLEVPPSKAVVIEDALAGVEAGRRGNFALVIGVDRRGHSEDLKQHGAHYVVPDLQYLELKTL
jgi:beta-phosphoglucomutase family hydrolase